MRNEIKSFKDLEVWRKGIQVVKNIYEVIKRLPKEEQFGLISQMRRASVSMPANIAEGFRRRHNREFRQFLHVALGSSGELETYLELCKEIYEIDDAFSKSIFQELDVFQRMTNTLIGRLRYD